MRGWLRFWRPAMGYVPGQMVLSFEEPQLASPTCYLLDPVITSRCRLELVREAQTPSLVDNPPPLNRTQAFARFLWTNIFSSEPREVLVVLFLDIRLRA